MHAPGYVRVEERPDTKIVAPTDVIVPLSGSAEKGGRLPRDAPMRPLAEKV
jgi:hypothetical protein